MSSPRSRVHLCGSLAVELDGERLEEALPGRQGRLVLAYLVANRDRPVRRDELMAALWTERVPQDPDAALRVVLAKLRAVVGPDRLHGRQVLRLALPEPAEVDLEAAVDAVAEAEVALAASSWKRARDRAKLALYVSQQGFLPALDAPWIEERRRELDDIGVRALECLAEASLALRPGERAAAERAARMLIERAPYRESGYQLLMEALAAAGNVAEALRVYDELRVRLREALGAAPAKELQTLHERLLRGREVRASVPRQAGSAVPLPPALPAGRGGAFVGRGRELGVLERCVERVNDEGMQLAFVAGEAGIGKSRLCGEFARAARRQGATVLYGRAYDEAVVPYQPFVEALAHYVRGRPLDELRRELGGSGELKRLLPGLDEVVQGLPELERADPESERYRTLQAVASLLAAATGTCPLVVVLDDLHWADDATLLMLEHLARAVPGCRLLLVGTYREGELRCGHPLEVALAELRRERPYEHLALGGLPDREVAEMVAGIAGDHAVPLARSIAERTEGNPFFVEELLRHLVEAGLLVEKGELATSEPGLEDVGVPEGVRQVIGRRVGRLSEATQRLLAVAAVVGQEFGFDVLERVADVPGDALVEALEEAVAARLVGEGPAPFGSYSFAHALIQETLYQQLSAARRARLHRRIAEALEDLYAPLFADPADELVPG